MFRVVSHRKCRHKRGADVSTWKTGKWFIGGEQYFKSKFCQKIYAICGHRHAVNSAWNQKENKIGYYSQDKKQLQEVKLKL